MVERSTATRLSPPFFKITQARAHAPGRDIAIHPVFFERRRTKKSES
jgi:hypothetical protein